MNDIKCEQVATLQGKFSRMFEQSRRVYGIDGLCPSIHTCGGGNTEIKVGYEEKKVIIYDDFNNRIKADQSVIGTVTPNFGNDAAGNGTKIIEKFKIAHCIGGIGEKKSNGGTQYYQQDRIYYGDVALAHPANLPGGSYKYLIEEPVKNNTISTERGRNLIENVAKQLEENDYKIYDDRDKGWGVKISDLCPTQRASRSGIKVINTESFRIRKLTPKECWRLMGQDDEDFSKAESVCSNTQLYKQAGNSIVVNVLEAIFSNLLIK